MLLNRKRVKFWQKLVFGFMAVLMALFLVGGGLYLIVGVVFGVSLPGLNQSGGTGSGNSQYESQIKAALKTLAKDPQDAAALLSAAQAYSAAGVVQSGQVPSDTQTTDLADAITYYERYIKLPDATLGATATGLRVNALLAEATIYSELIDYKSAVATYERALKIEPSRSELYLTIAENELSAGDKAAAIKAYQKFLAVDPHSQFAAQVKSALAQLQASASPSPSPSAS